MIRKMMGAAGMVVSLADEYSILDYLSATRHSLPGPEWGIWGIREFYGEVSFAWCV